MKKLLILLLFLVGCIDQEPFCGTSTHESCETKEDCIDAGCSGQICQAKTKDMTFTTCEFKPCYEANIYGMECQCIENKCQWA